MLVIKVSFVVAMLGLWLQAPTALAATGRAVFYEPNSDGFYHPSACNGDQRFPGRVAGVKGTLWDNKGACGRKYKVKCIRAANNYQHACKDGQSVVVTVVDLCRETCNGDLNLSKDAFEAIADVKAGVISIEYTPA